MARCLKLAQDKLRLLGPSAPGQREPLELAWPGCTRKLSLERLDHGEGLVVPTELDQTLGHVTAEHWRRPPTHGVRLGQFQQTRVAARVQSRLNRELGLAYLLIYSVAKAHCCVGERLIEDSIKQPQQSATQGPLAVLGEISIELPLRKQRQLNRIELGNAVMEAARQRFLLHGAVFFFAPLGVLRARGPDKNPGSAVIQPSL